MLIDKLKMNFIKSKNKVDDETNARIKHHEDKITKKLIEASNSGKFCIDHWFSTDEDEYVISAILSWLSGENLSVNITESLFGNTIFDISGWS